MFPEHPLLCVFGQNLEVPYMLPEDAICDYLFYSDVFLQNDQLVSFFSPTSFRVFVQAAKNYSRSQFGFSFHPE